jgi:hypothetical protein
VAEEDEQPKRLSALELKLAAIAAAGAARGKVIVAEPEPEPEPTIVATESLIVVEETAVQQDAASDTILQADPERAAGDIAPARAQEVEPLENLAHPSPEAPTHLVSVDEAETAVIAPAAVETATADPAAIVPDAPVEQPPGYETMPIAAAATEQESTIVSEAGPGTAPLTAPASEAVILVPRSLPEDPGAVASASALRAPAIVDPNAPIESEPRTRLPVTVRTTRRLPRGLDPEYAATAGLLGAVLVIGLASVSNYAITPQEFRYDEIGTRLLSLYGGGERAAADAANPATSNVLAQWFQVLTAAVQSFIPANRFDVRHALTFLVGLGGLAALLPLGRIAVGRWAGLTAIVLCLLTGNFYGHLFFSPVDVPFMAAMTWATMAIVLMAGPMRPGWAAVVAAGLFTGLAIASRPAGLLSHGLLLLAMLLCICEAVFRFGRASVRPVLRILLQTVIALALAWIVAIALLPTLHGPDLRERLRAMFTGSASEPAPASIISWGREWATDALPWHYLPGELLARLSGVFVVLLGLALLVAIGSLLLFLVRRRRANRELGNVGTPMLMFFLLVRSRAALIVALAAVLPILFVMIVRPPLHDGIRLMLFIVPPLALLAAWGFLRLSPLIRTFPLVAAALIGMQIGGGVLVIASQHPLEYITTNAFAGGTRGSYGRFELDYWGAAATEALRKLEQRLDYDRRTRFASDPPHILICSYLNEQPDTALFKRPWAIAETPAAADFIIETRKARCGAGAGGAPIDEVKRRDQPFAWTLEMPASAEQRDEISD